MFNFDKVNEKIMESIKEPYVFNYCLLNVLNVFPKELILFVLELQTFEERQELRNVKQDEELCFLLELTYVSFGYKIRNEPVDLLPLSFDNQILQQLIDHLWKYMMPPNYDGIEKEVRQMAASFNINQFTIDEILKQNIKNQFMTTLQPVLSMMKSRQLSPFESIMKLFSMDIKYHPYVDCNI